MNGETRRILVAEDDRFLRKAAEMALKRQGYTVLTAADGEEALRAARSVLPDLILLDLIMPKLNGFDVLQALKKDAPTAHIPVIILSNLGQDRDVQQAMEAGAAAYFIKTDLSLQALVQRVEETLTAGGV
jgi:two-component system, OmpR family, phosphate regulon response regulator PhoB